MPPAVPCVSECSSLATGTPAFVVVGRCSAAVMTKSPRLLVTVLEARLGRRWRPAPRRRRPASGPGTPRQCPPRRRTLAAGPGRSARRYGRAATSKSSADAGCPHARRASGQLVQLVNIRAGPLPRVLPGGHTALVEQGQEGVVTIRHPPAGHREGPGRGLEPLDQSGAPSRRRSSTPSAGRAGNRACEPLGFRHSFPVGVELSATECPKPLSG